MTNWPWPMGGVQDWFEGLWEWVGQATVNAVAPVSAWIWDGLEWLKTQLGYSFSWLGTKIGTLWTNISGALSSGWSAMTTSLSNAVADIKARLEALVGGIDIDLGGILSSIGATLLSGLQGFGSQLSSTASWIGDQLATKIGDLTDTVRAYVDDAVMGGMDWVTKAIAGVAESLGAGFQAFFTWMVEGVQWMATSVAGSLADVRGAIERFFTPVATGILEALTSSVSPGSPDEDTVKQAQAFAEGYLKQIMELAEIEAESLPELSALLPKAVSVVALNMGAALAANVAGVALDQTHPMKNIGFQYVAQDLINSVQMPAMIGPILQGPVWPGIIMPMRYRFNEMYPTTIPDPRVLRELASRGAVAVEEYTQAMKFHALDESWSSAMLAAAYRTPGFPELQIMAWRGVLSEEALRAALTLQGVRPDYLDGYVAIVERIPGPMDLVRMAVREAFTREELQVEFPDEFGVQMARQGFAEIWSKYFWAAHWVLVPLGQLYDMFHRGIIGEAELTDQLKYHDYTPEWRARLIKLSWDLPGRIDARWMFRWGMITMDGLRDLLVKRGLDPEYADRVAMAYARNQWLVEINKLRDNLKRDYVKGYKDEAELRVGLEGLGYPATWIEFHVQDAVEDGERDLKDDIVDALGDGYLKDLISEEELEMSLGAVIVRPEALYMELERLYTQKFKKPKPPEPEKIRVVPVSTLLRAFREEIIVEGDLISELEARGYPPEDIELIIALELERMVVAE